MALVRLERALGHARPARLGRALHGASAELLGPARRGEDPDERRGERVGVLRRDDLAGAIGDELGEGRGIVVAPEDPDALAAALADVLAGRGVPDPALGRAYADGFRLPEVAALYARTYAELAQEARRVTGAAG